MLWKVNLLQCLHVLRKFDIWPKYILYILYDIFPFPISKKSFDIKKACILNLISIKILINVNMIYIPLLQKHAC